MNLLETYGRYLSNDWGLAYDLINAGHELIVLARYAYAYRRSRPGTLCMEGGEPGMISLFMDDERQDIAVCNTVEDFVVAITDFGIPNNFKFLVPPGMVSRRQDQDSHIPEKPQHQGPPIGMRDSITSIEGGTV